MPTQYTKQQLLARQIRRMEDNGRFFLFYDKLADRDFVWDSKTGFVTEPVPQSPEARFLESQELVAAIKVLARHLMSPTYSRLSAQDAQDLLDIQSRIEASAPPVDLPTS